METKGILWRRLDAPGHDACRLVQLKSGWRLEGAAAFRHESGAAACVTYEVECDNAWRTRVSVVRGWVGGCSLDIRLARTPSGKWRLNDKVVAELEGCVDLDLGFTPATNLFQLRRMGLQVGQADDVSVAWLDVPDGTLKELRQRYERRTTDDYWYEAPQFDFAAYLHVSKDGFVMKYPGLWEVEAADNQQDASTKNAEQRD